MMSDTHKDLKINCMLGTKFEELKPVEKEMDDFIKKHNKKCPHHIKSRPETYWDKHRKWEYAMALAFTNPKKGDKVLDVGSANSVLSWVLANRGVDVICIDLLKDAYEAGVKNESYFKFPNITHLHEEIKEHKRSNEYDFIYSMCVIEHIMEIKRREMYGPYKSFWNDGYEPTKELWAEEELALQRHYESLKPGGVLVISYDYNQAKTRGARFRTPEDVYDRIINKSSFKLYGDKPQIKNSEIGILFLQK